MEHRSISLADQIFSKLENDILSGVYERGEILTETKLSAELGVSRTPIREALRRLSQEHIIEETQKGSLVLGISKQDIKDIFTLRKSIEGFAAEAAAKSITDEQIAELKEIVDLQEFYVLKANTDNIKLMDNRFHESVYLFSGSTIFYDTLVPLHKKTQKARRTSVSHKSRAEISVKEHRAIFEAIAAHDSEKAKSLMETHVKNAEANILGKDI